MPRSLKKGPFVDDHLEKKVAAAKASNDRRLIKTWSRRSVILPDFIGTNIAVHNGNKFIPIFITEDMNLFGWKTRLEFIDACFNEMKVLVDDARHPANTIRQWQYAIRTGNIMDFFLPDADNTITYPDITLSIDNNNVIDEKIISSIDTSRLINAITVVSKDDETIYAQLEDMGSQEKYGVISYFLQYPSLDRNELEDVAYKILNQYRDPSITYTVSLTNTDNLDLGDIIKIDMPSLPSSAVKRMYDSFQSFEKKWLKQEFNKENISSFDINPNDFQTGFNLVLNDLNEYLLKKSEE